MAYIGRITYYRVKAAVRGGASGDLEAALATELRGQLQLLRSRDFAEGLASFFEKRDPVWKGE